MSNLQLIQQQLQEELEKIDQTINFLTQQLQQKKDRKTITFLEEQIEQQNRIIQSLTAEIEHLHTQLNQNV